MRRIGLVVLSLNVLVYASCAGGGPMYWTRAGSDAAFAQFKVDHQACLPTFSKDGIGTA